MTEGLDRTRALGTGTGLPPEGTTLMSTTVACGLCGLANSPLETYCADCGLLLGSKPGSVDADAQKPVAHLRDERTGRTYPIYPGANTIGRGTGTIVIMEPSLSRSHAVVTAGESGLTIADMGSANGTIVDGVALTPNTEADLRAGSVIRLGATQLSLDIVGQSAEVPASVPDARASEAFLEPAGGGDRFALALGTTSVGRRPESTVVLGDAYVSGRHAEIVGNETGWRLRDLGSTNGTSLDGVRLEAEAWHDLLPGAEVRFGQAAFTFLLAPRTDEPGPGEPAE